jgi:hypothetical protein
MKTSARLFVVYRAHANTRQLSEKETTFGALVAGTNAPGQAQRPEAATPVTLS